MRVTFAAAGALLVLALSGCDQAGAPAPSESPSTASAETVQARVTGWDAEGRAITLDRVAMLSGQEAVAAAREDGQMPPGEESLPNDFYIDDVEGEPEQAEVAPDATARVFDCTAECTLTAVPFDDLLVGKARPMNGDSAIFEVRLRDGVVTGLDEIYTP